jgi:sulfocyanin
MTTGLTLAGSLLTPSTHAAPTQAAAAASHWLKVNKSTRHVVVTVIAGLNSSNRGFNFDGYSKGKANFVVPRNWTVQFTFSNHGAAPHSLALATSHGNNPTLARIGGKHVEIPNATQGITEGKTVHLTFKAKTAGKYYLICAVPGHDAFGMWDYFTISKGARVPSLKLR